MAFNKQGPKGRDASRKTSQESWSGEGKKSSSAPKNSGFGARNKGQQGNGQYGQSSNRSYQSNNRQRGATIQPRGGDTIAEGSKRFGPRSINLQEAPTFAAAPQRKGEGNSRYNRENPNSGKRPQGNRRPEGARNQDGFKRGGEFRGGEGFKRSEGPRSQDGFKRGDEFKRSEGPKGDGEFKRGEAPKGGGEFKRRETPKRSEGFRSQDGFKKSGEFKRGETSFREQKKPSYKDFQYSKEPINNENEKAEGEELQSIVLAGRNPIREALKSGRDLEKLMVQKGELSGSAKEIVMLAKEAKIPVQVVEKIRLDAITHNHQGMIAVASAFAYATVEDILAVAKERGEDPFIILLDGITDPHNLGAIIRSGECAGAHGVIVPVRRSVGLTPAAVKASAGAVEYMKVARVTNLVRTIEDLQEKGVWVFGADGGGEDYQKADFSGPCALVIGAEGEGVSKLVLSKCDHVVSLPVRGQIDSLNASVAAGILLYRILESRR